MAPAEAINWTTFYSNSRRSKDDKLADPETLDSSDLATIAGISEKELDSAAKFTDAIVGWALKVLSLSKMTTRITLSSALTAKLMKYSVISSPVPTLAHSRRLSYLRIEDSEGSG